MVCICNGSCCLENVYIFFLENLSEAWDIIKENNIPFECCLSSNVKCGTVKKFDDHHFKKLRNEGIPAFICVSQIKFIIKSI